MTLHKRDARCWLWSLILTQCTVDALQPEPPTLQAPWSSGRGAEAVTGDSGRAQAGGDSGGIAGARAPAADSGSRPAEVTKLDPDQSHADAGSSEADADVPPSDAGPSPGDSDAAALPTDALVTAPRSVVAIEQADYLMFGQGVGVSNDRLVIAGLTKGSDDATGPGVAQTRVPDGSGWSNPMLLSASTVDPSSSDAFSTNMMLAGDVLVIGAATTITQQRAGVVDVFKYEGAGWQMQAQVRPTTPSLSTETFGARVAVAADTLVALAVEPDLLSPYGPTPLGSVYVFTQRGSSWEQAAQLRASNGKGGDGFGEALAVAGDTLVVGAPREDSRGQGIDGDMANDISFPRAGEVPGVGAAYVFARRNGVWVQEAYLKAADAADLDFFGSSVAFDGRTLVIGAPGRSLGGQIDRDSNVRRNAGAAYLFERGSAGWMQTGVLEPKNAGGNDRFGASVALFGNRLLIGAPDEASAAHGVDGDANDDSAQGSGAAYLFERGSSGWQQVAYLKPTLTRDWGEFGSSVALDAKRAVVGAPGSNWGAGVVYVFE